MELGIFLTHNVYYIRLGVDRHDQFNKLTTTASVYSFPNNLFTAATLSSNDWCLSVL